MLALGLFYFLLLLLIVLIIYMILLFDNYKSRTLAPPLMNAFYGIESLDGIKIGSDNIIYNQLNLTNGLSVTNSEGVCGGIMFSSSGPSSIPFNFVPQYEDMYRPINGMFRLLLAGRDQGRVIRLLIDDQGDKIVDGAQFYIAQHTEGLTEIKIPFTAKDLRDTDFNSSNGHNFQFYGLSMNGTGRGGSIGNNDILVNSAYVTYY